MTVFDLVLGLLIVLPAGDLLAAFILGRIALRHPDQPVLREWALYTVLAALGAGAVAFLALNRVLNLGFPRELGTIVLVLVLVGISLPPYRWLYLYWRGRF